MNANHDLTYCPIDLPRYESQGEISRNFDVKVVNAVGAQDRLVSIYSEDGLPYHTARPWLEGTREKFPRLIEYIETHLPYRSICIAKILRSTNNLGWHVDIGRFDAPEKHFYDYQYENSPCAYRVVLEGQYEEVLYYAAYHDLPKDKWICSRLPDSTNVFVHGCDSIHRTSYDFSINRYILFIHGYLDLDRHRELLDRSRKKYADYVITYQDMQARL